MDDGPRDVPNEANEPAGSARSLAVAVLAVLALLLFAGISAAFVVGTASERSSSPVSVRMPHDSQPDRTAHRQSAPEGRAGVAAASVRRLIYCPTSRSESLPEIVGGILRCIRKPHNGKG